MLRGALSALISFFKFRLDGFRFTSMLSSASRCPFYGNVYLHFVNNIIRKTQNFLKTLDSFSPALMPTRKLAMLCFSEKRQKLFVKPLNSAIPPSKHCGV